MTMCHFDVPRRRSSLRNLSSPKLGCCGFQSRDDILVANAAPASIDETVDADEEQDGRDKQVKLLMVGDRSQEGWPQKP